MTSASASNINNYYLLFQNSMGILNLLLWICNNFPAKAIVNNIYQLKCHFLNTMKQRLIQITKKITLPLPAAMEISLYK